MTCERAHGLSRPARCLYDTVVRDFRQVTERAPGLA